MATIKVCSSRIDKLTTVIDRNEHAEWNKHWISVMQWQWQEGEVEDASISPTLSHTEAPELQNISRMAESIKTQEDFLTNIHEGVSGRFPDFTLVMSRASVNSDTQIPVLTINQCHLFVYPPYGMVSHIQGYVQFKMFCNLSTSVWLSVGLILASSTSTSLSLPSHNWNPVLIPLGVLKTINNSS